MVGGEEKALQFATVQDLPADSAMVISQVCSITAMFAAVYLLVRASYIEESIFHK